MAMFTLIAEWNTPMV